MINTVEQLIAIENIKQLKYRYFRALDCNDWNAFGATLTQDCEANYSSGHLHFDGRDAIVDFMRTNMSSAQFLSMHTAHHPEITISDDFKLATGAWYLQDTVLIIEAKRKLYGTAIYKDEYINVDGQWLISKTGYDRIFECIEPISDEHNVLQSCFS